MNQVSRARQGIFGVLTVLACVIGFLVTQDIRTVDAINHTAEVTQGKGLTYLITQNAKQAVAQEHQIARLQQRVAAMPRPANLSHMQSLLATARVTAGLRPASGAGVEVVIHDATSPVFPGEPPILELVHDQYVLRVIAILSGAGAYAIAVNGQRYTSTSSIFCAGPTIRVNGVPYASPYVIRAVGPTSAMMKAMAEDPDIQGWAQLVSIKYHTDSRLQLPAYTLPMHFSVAKPAKIGT